jgi:hypothetical protein
MVGEVAPLCHDSQASGVRLVMSMFTTKLKISVTPA